MSIFESFDQMHDQAHYTSHSNIFGGETVYENGVAVQESQPNIFGGENLGHGRYTMPDHIGGTGIYENGQHIGQITENPDGTKNVYEHGHLVKTVHPNVLGGEDVIGANGHMIMQSAANVFGGEDVLYHHNAGNAAIV